MNIVTTNPFLELRVFLELKHNGKLLILTSFNLFFLDMKLIHMVFWQRLVKVNEIHLDISNVELLVDMFTVPEVKETGTHILNREKIHRMIK